MKVIRLFAVLAFVILIAAPAYAQVQNPIEVITPKGVPLEITAPPGVPLEVTAPACRKPYQAQQSSGGPGGTTTFSFNIPIPPQQSLFVLENVSLQIRAGSRVGGTSTSRVSSSFVRTVLDGNTVDHFFLTSLQSTSSGGGIRADTFVGNESLRIYHDTGSPLILEVLILGSFTANVSGSISGYIIDLTNPNCNGLGPGD
jgi:hypothetical protein